MTTPYKERVGDWWIIERPEKGHRLYLRRRVTTATGLRNWQWVSTREACRTESGRLVMAAVQRARDAVRVWQPSGDSPRGTPSEALPTAGGALRLRASIGLLTSSDRGLYPHDTPHRREVERALRLAVETWGADRPWETITRADWRALWRASLTAAKVSGRARSGVRAAEIAVSRVATIVRHLVEEGHVSRIVLPAKDWRAQVRAA